MADLKPCPNPWCNAQNTYVDWHPSGFRVECGECDIGAPFAKTKEAAIAAWNTRPAPKVKPLEWDELEQDRGDGTADLTGNHEATSVVGVYEIELGFGSDACYWSVAMDGEEIGHSFDDLIYAKAAAQADYSARILAALMMGDA